MGYADAHTDAVAPEHLQEAKSDLTASISF